MSNQQRHTKKNITIYDLAKELNVSASTVSRALKKHKSISKETVEKVEQLAKERGYRPNLVAASLRTQRTTNIGMLMPWINRPFVSDLISGAEKTARENGYNVIISQSHDSFDNEVDNAKALLDSQVCSLIVSLAMETQIFDHFTAFLENDTPLVFVDRVPESLDCYKVIIDNYRAGFKATQHLIEQGCKRIAILCGETHQNIYRDRLEGYLAALKQYNMPVDESLILKGKVLSSEEGFNLATYLLSLPNPPDAIFSTNDKAALSVIQHAKSIGVKIPEELAVIGFNDDPECQIVEPQLSSVIHPAMEMGGHAVQLALSLIEGKAVQANDSKTIVLDTDLVIRASSQRLRK
ncbi:MAG: LacI family DNA-binding transcriptional regulator [Phaeodactylibacter sp.]|nr:LacI family DNA-binding transcriptional regulator [Phaeodactylibacter sp.]